MLMPSNCAFAPGADEVYGIIDSAPAWAGYLFRTEAEFRWALRMLPETNKKRPDCCAEFAGKNERTCDCRGRSNEHRNVATAPLL